MLKGCKKQMIVLRGTGSEIFDVAYFILKNGIKPEDHTAMLIEANRIIEENRINTKRPQNTRSALKSTLIFALGALLGAGLVLFSVILT